MLSCVVLALRQPSVCGALVSCHGELAGATKESVVLRSPVIRYLLVQTTMFVVLWSHDMLHLPVQRSCLVVLRSPDMLYLMAQQITPSTPSLAATELSHLMWGCAILGLVEAPLLQAVVAQTMELARMKSTKVLNRKQVRCNQSAPLVLRLTTGSPYKVLPLSTNNEVSWVQLYILCPGSSSSACGLCRCFTRVLHKYCAYVLDSRTKYCF
jgi:hypothetical protein